MPARAPAGSWVVARCSWSFGNSEHGGLGQIRTADILCAVGRGIVGNMKFNVFVVLSQQRIECPLEKRFAVVDRHADAYEGFMHGLVKNLLDISKERGITVRLV